VFEEVIFRFHLLSPLFVSLGKEERGREGRGGLFLSLEGLCSLLN
jgi:hypothetical protein